MGWFYRPNTFNRIRLNGNLACAVQNRPTPYVSAYDSHLGDNVPDLLDLQQQVLLDDLRPLLLVRWVVEDRVVDFVEEHGDVVDGSC